MPDIGLPTGASRNPKGPGSKGGRGFNKRGGGSSKGLQLVAHDIGGEKERTDDVVTGESRDATFPSLLLSKPVLKGLQTAGFVQPSPVQLMAIPPAKVGFDLIVQSKSGTGKTCVYVVAALEMLKPDLQGLQALVLAPTREIAIQGVTVAMQIGQEMGQVKMAAFIGGISLAEDKVKAKTCQLGVGTPGRLKQLITEGILPVDSVRLVVLDEADKLLEPSFLGDTTAILNLLPKSKQVLALSATYPDQLASLAERFMRSPQHIRPGQTSQVLTGVAQFLYTVQHCPAPARQTSIKQAALLTILSSVPYTQVLVFSNYSTIAQATADFLNSRGFPAIFISAGQDQARRLAAIQTFKQFNCRILCSTDLTARGIDAENVNLVINMEVPWEQNTYLHRIGRGGRFGSLSLAVTLASEGVEVGRMRVVVRKTGSVIRILPKDLPRDVRGEMNAMEVLEADEGEEEKDKESGVNNEMESFKEKGEVEKKSGTGKVKKRGKRRAYGETAVDAEFGKDVQEIRNTENENTDNQVTVNVMKSDAKDEELVSEFLDEQKRTKVKSKVLTFEEISEIASKLEQGVEVHMQDEVEYVVDIETMEKVGQAVQRMFTRRREDYIDRLTAAQQKMEGKEISLLLEKLAMEEPFDPEMENMGNIKPANITAEDSNTLKSDSCYSSDSESDSESSSSSTSDSDTGSSSTSGSESDSQQPPEYQNQYPSYHQYTPRQSFSTGGPSYHSPSSGQYTPYVPPFHTQYTPYPPTGQFTPYPPPPPGHPSAQAWYTHWAATVAQQRQMVQQVEYNKYMQFLAINQSKK